MGIVERIQGLATSIRRDGWQNNSTGLGTWWGDRGQRTEFVADSWLDDATLTALYHNDDICNTVASVYPKHALRKGWKTTKTAQDECVRLRARECIEEAATWGRLYGGGLVVIGTDDGAPSTEWLDPSHVSRVNWLQVYDKRDVYRDQYFAGSDDELFSEAKTFR